MSIAGEIEPVRPTPARVSFKAKAAASSLHEVGPDRRLVDIRQFGKSGRCGHLDKFLLQNLDQALGAGGAVCRKAPPRRPTDHHAIGPQCERLEDVGAATDTTIEHDGYPA